VRVRIEEPLVAARLATSLPRAVATLDRLGFSYEVTRTIAAGRHEATVSPPRRERKRRV
jgi:hypothetical protein